ncbi:MAG TPA: MFS transporter [Streptosporangiaceae bacterium]|nr:MFS transporter [Streptosporangiaceae bacterium]
MGTDTADTATPAAPTDETPARAGRREWIGLAVLALPTLLVSIDVFVMLLALPHLSEALGASSTQTLWIMDIYGFMIAGFLVTMGTLGDRIGRRRLLLIGAAAFGAASVLAAYATSPQLLIAARAVLGIAGATLAPSTLALISNMFRDPRQRATAIGVWLACFMSGAAIGPLAGGAMLERFWWGSVFLLGVPAMVLLLVVGPFLLPEYRAPGTGRVDITSVMLSLAAILPIIYGLKELAKDGWRAGSVAAAATGCAVGVAFVRRQRRLADPLLDLRLFRSASFSAALAGMLACTLLGGAIMVFITQYFQLVRGLSPLRAGLWMLPTVAAMMVSCQAAPLLARRFRPALLICVGLAITVTGLLVIARAGATSGLPAVVTGFALINLGSGPLVALGSDLVVGSAPPERAGSAAALNQTAGEFGFAFGIAALGSLGTAVYRARFAGAAPDTARDGVPADAIRAAHDSLTGAVGAAQHLPARAAEALLGPAQEAFTSGLHAIAAVSAVLLAGVTVLLAILLRHVRPIGAARPDEMPAPAPGSGSDAGTGPDGAAAAVTTAV